MNNPLNPHDLKDWVSKTTEEAVHETAEVTLATEISNAIQDAYTHCHERPRWQSWWDQVNRAAMSVLLNIAQGYGKGRGYTQSDFMIARGEAYEVSAALAIGPREITDPLKPKVKELIKTVNERLLDIADKPPTYNSKTYRSNQY